MPNEHHAARPDEAARSLEARFRNRKWLHPAATNTTVPQPIRDALIEAFVDELCEQAPVGGRRGGLADSDHCRINAARPEALEDSE